MKSKSRQSGFSLLEAIVALTILATSGLALFSWLSVSFDGLFRLREMTEKQEVMEDLHAFFSTLNIQHEGAESLMVNGYTVTWDAHLYEPVQTGRSMAGGASNFDLGLYNVDIQVAKGRRNLGTYTTRLVGYSKVRNIDSDDRQ